MECLQIPTARINAATMNAVIVSPPFAVQIIPTKVDTNIGAEPINAIRELLQPSTNSRE
jgi:hypothetical protein